MRGIVFPVLLIVIGAGWLLNKFDYFPSMRWLVILGLLVAGVAILAIEGVNKSTVVLAPMLIASGLAILFRLQYGLAWSLQWPVLLILWGALLLLARSKLIAPAPPKS